MVGTAARGRVHLGEAAVTSPQDFEEGHRPDYPPRTPPPPKKPVEPPRPENQADAETALIVQPRLRARISNRRAANWTYEAAKWSAPKAGGNTVDKLRSWGYRIGEDHTAGELAARLVTAALEDGGSRISLHLADQDNKALILVLSHQPGHAPLDDTLLAELAALGVVSCGVDTDQEDGGRRRWVLIDV